MPENLLYYGDNLEVLPRYVRDESVDLVYLDPPFSSNQNYNVLFDERDGSQAAAQIKAFGDTWQWGRESAETCARLIETGPEKVSQAVQAFRTLLGDTDMMAYLAMMAPRLLELARVLKPTGVLYLHCDPTASHYLKLLLDAVFGPRRFVNEIVWQRTNAHNMKGKGWPRHHDTLLMYSRTPNYFLKPVYGAYSEAQLKRFKPDSNGRLYKAENMTFSTKNPSRQFEWRGTKPPDNRSWGASLEQLEKWWAEGRILVKRDGTPRLDGLKIFLDETAGKQIGSVWIDIPRISNTAAERLGYPTQKPEALLERIIEASCPEGGVVLDPFCGCGTTIAAAQKLGRPWIGIDITHLAITLIRNRLQDAFGRGAAPKVIGEPVSLPDAVALAGQDRYQFQWWALGLVGARPTEQKRGADRGIDGRLYFHDERAPNKPKQIIFSVKSGGVSSGDLRDLRGVLDRERADIGVLITLEPPSRHMEREANSGDFYNSSWGRHPRIQILTIEQLLAGAHVDYPAGRVNVTFKPAPRKRVEVAEPLDLPLVTDPAAIMAERAEAEARRRETALGVPSARRRSRREGVTGSESPGRARPGAETPDELGPRRRMPAVRKRDEIPLAADKSRKR